MVAWRRAPRPLVGFLLRALRLLFGFGLFLIGLAEFVLGPLNVAGLAGGSLIIFSRLQALSPRPHGARRSRASRAERGYSAVIICFARSVPDPRAHTTDLSH
ncbi:MAG: hypothetical protein A07HR60_02316 [uncultured archaeon A07HR60]|nr:MAG: hypothetical protein A07HR60_02316 [uncultured archaeon A07HR60]